MRFGLAFLACLLCLTGPAAGGDLCLVDSPNGFNVTVDCDPLNGQIHDNAVIGFSEEGTPCLLGECVVVGQGRFGEHYGWQISASDTDPNVNVGPLPGPLANLYLWLNCTGPAGGMAAAEMGVVADNAELQVIVFSSRNGVLNAGTATHLLLAVGGCPVEPFLLGEFTLLNVPPISVEADTWGGIKSMYR